VVNDWHDLEASQNVCIISIPTVFDKSLAPAGKATIHAYVAANEPYGLWEGLDRKSKEYKDLKVIFCPFAQCRLDGEVKGPCPPGCPRSSFNDVALCDCQACHVSRPHMHVQDRLLWRNKTCPAPTIMSWKALVSLLLSLSLLFNIAILLFNSRMYLPGTKLLQLHRSWVQTAFFGARLICMFFMIIIYCFDGVVVTILLQQCLAKASVYRLLFYKAAEKGLETLISGSPLISGTCGRSCPHAVLYVLAHCSL